MSSSATDTAAEVGVDASTLTVGIPAETKAGEKRVAATAETVKMLVKEGYKVAVERGAGSTSAVTDEAYIAAGATIVDRASAFGSDIVLKVAPPNDDEVAMLKTGATLVSYIYPAVNTGLVEQLKGKAVTVVGMDCLPRTLSRAQVESATEPPMWILACFQTSSDTFQCVCVLLRSSSSSKPPPSPFSIRSHLSLYICAYIYYMISLSIYMHQLSLYIYVHIYHINHPLR